MHANRLFIRDVVTVSANDDLVHAAKLMRTNHIGFLVVAEKRGNDLYPVGVITDRDIVLESTAQEIAPRSIRVADIMTSTLIFTTEFEDLESLLPRMCAAGVRRAPIVNSVGALVGVVSFDNFLQSMASMLNGMAGAAVKQRETERKHRN